MQQNPNHLCIMVRLSNFYLLLNLCQLSLTLAYLITYHLALTEMASWIQICLALLILVDISIKILSERKQFWYNRWNIIDTLIFCAVLVSVLVTCTHTDGLHHHTSNTFGAVMVALRYCGQSLRLLLLIKNSKQIHEQKKFQGMISLKPGFEIGEDMGEGIDGVA